MAKNNTVLRKLALVLAMLAGAAAGQQVYLGPSLGSGSLVGAVLGADFGGPEGGFGVRLVGGAVPLLFGLSYEVGADGYYRFGPPGSGAYVGGGVGYGRFSIGTDGGQASLVHVHALVGYDFPIGPSASFFLEAMPGIAVGATDGLRAGPPAFWPGFGLGLKSASDGWFRGSGLSPWRFPMSYSLTAGLRRSLPLLGLVFLTACPPREYPVDFATDPSILRGRWTATLENPVLGSNFRLAWSGDGRAVFAGGGPTLYRWTVESAAAAPLPTGRDLADLAISPDGARLAVLEPQPGRVSVRLLGPNGENSSNGENEEGSFSFETARGSSASPAPALAWSPDGRLVVAEAVGLAQGVVAWDAATGQRRFGRALPGQNLELAFSRDGGRLAVYSTGQTLHLLDPSSGAPLHEVKLEGESRSGSGLASSRSENLFAVGLGGKVVLVGPDGERRGELPGEASALAFSPDGTRLAVSRSSGPIRLWSLASGAVTRLPPDRTLEAVLDLEARLISARQYAVTGVARLDDGTAGRVQGTISSGSGRLVGSQSTPALPGGRLVITDAAGVERWRLNLRAAGLAYSGEAVQAGPLPFRFDARLVAGR